MSGFEELGARIGRKLSSGEYTPFRKGGRGRKRPGLVSGTLVLDEEGVQWVYVGGRRTTAGTIERVFVRILPGLPWPGCMRTYMASRAETLQRRFPVLEGVDLTVLEVPE